MQLKHRCSCQGLFCRRNLRVKFRLVLCQLVTQTL